MRVSPFRIGMAALMAMLSTARPPVGGGHAKGIGRVPIVRRSGFVGASGCIYLGNGERECGRRRAQMGLWAQRRKIRARGDPGAALGPANRGLPA